MIETDDERINNKHYRIRKTHELKYPANESRCRNTCGIRHDFTKNSLGLQRVQEHRCYLSISHTGYCEFSSECGELRIRRVYEPSTLADDGCRVLQER